MKALFLIFACLFPAALFAPNADKKKPFCYRYDYCEEMIFVSNWYQIDPEITLAMILHESNTPVGDYDLSRKKFLVGADGEFGLAQVMPYNFPPKLPVRKRYEPIHNFGASLAYLSFCKRKFGNYRNALMCYNKGPSKRRWKPAYAEAVFTKLKLLRREYEKP